MKISLECKANGGKPNTDCVFPFHYKGIVYTACTDSGSEGNFWCSTKVDDEWNHVTGNWKRCEPMCYKGNDTYTTCTVYNTKIV